MFKAFGMLWTGMSVFFLAFEKLSLIFLHLCTAGSEMAEDVLNTQRRERLAELKASEAAELLLAQASAKPVAKPKAKPVATDTTTA